MIELIKVYRQLSLVSWSCGLETKGWTWRPGRVTQSGPFSMRDDTETEELMKGSSPTEHRQQRADLPLAGKWAGLFATSSN